MKNGPCIGYFPIKTSIQFGDFPASHVWFSGGNWPSGLGVQLRRVVAPSMGFKKCVLIFQYGMKISGSRYGEMSIYILHCSPVILYLLRKMRINIPIIHDICSHTWVSPSQKNLKGHSKRLVIQYALSLNWPHCYNFSETGSYLGSLGDFFRSRFQAPAALDQHGGIPGLWRIG